MKEGITPSFFSGPRTDVRGPKFHYITALTFCQEAMLHKKRKIKIPYFVHFTTCISRMAVV